MNTLDYILHKFNIDQSAESPIEIPNVGRNDLVKLTNELNFKVGVEVGVARGEYSQKICEANPQMKLYSIDAWTAYGNYPDYTAETLESYFKETKERLAPFPNCEIIRAFSMETVRRFADNSLDFVYIDSNHQDPFITEDITEWSKKVKSGGIVSGHDYRSGYKTKNWTHHFDVIRATHQYTKNNNIKPWFVLGLKEKIPGLVRDSSRSWFWVK